MPDDTTFEFVVQTPHEVVWRSSVHAIRVLTETGQVGLRRRTEPTVMAIEAGVINVRSTIEDKGADHFVGTAGGMLICDVNRVTLLTPIAVVGRDEVGITKELQKVINQPNSEMGARAALSKLEGHIVSELQREQKSKSGRKLTEMV